MRTEKATTKRKTAVHARPWVIAGVLALFTCVPRLPTEALRWAQCSARSVTAAANPCGSYCTLSDRMAVIGIRG